ncbi:MAG TPA: hypothetical protein VNV35_11120, partial [Puia sp.]|nr:hypothetical protein [Puia sp.]
MAEEGSLRDFILRKNREVLLCAIGILVIQFTVIKFLYPSANLMPDSHYYVEAAMNNMELCAWPIGYSKFLEWVHIFVHRDWAVVSLQYFFLESAVLYFYFSIKYLLSPGKWVSRLVLLSLLMNPFILCMSNYILSDSLFA